METIPQRLEAVRARLRAQGASACIVPSSDYHGSEYVSPHFRLREYLTGFDGSAGTLVILEKGAYLWTDGRYFLQAETQLQGSGVTLMRIGERGVPAFKDFLHDALSENAAVAFDGRTMDAAAVKELRMAFADKGIELRSDPALFDGVWPSRPPLPDAPAWALDERFAGESAESKLKWLRREMEKHAADVWALCDCEDIAWLLNLRGGDLPHTPVPLCFCFVEKERVCLCMDASKRDAALTAALEALGVEFRPYEGAYGFACRYEQGATVVLTESKVNYALWEILAQNTLLLDVEDAIGLRKAIRNPVQIENLQRAHVKDGVALTRFIYEMQQSGAGLTESAAAKKLDAFRLATDGCIGLSFDTICGYGENAAVVHYRALPGSDAKIQARGFLLVDSGGQYYEGTTDVTRTIVMGALTKEEKRHYTLVLKGMLALMDARFPAGTRGVQLDVLARAPLWSEGLDYRHGTGHGVGYLLGVHEDPVRIRNAREDFVFMPGMTVSDEPGVYCAGSHGVRLENLLLCRVDADTPYGRFLSFEPLTLAPFALEAIEDDMLSREEADALNRYHARVYEALSPAFSGEALAWLKQATRPI
ncbi:MAG: aminopeptidase P family protein [Eubacteriales bacterium]|nr:aminopeptidase P family protein [Eubacteriales bacterium]